jgi:spermidine synthase
VPLRRLSTHQTSWQKLELWTSKREVEMRVEGAVHAWWHNQRLLSGLAWDIIAAAALLRPAGPPASVLMLGLAGGTSLRILRHLLPQASLTALEIDEEIVGIARGAMHLDDLGLEIRITDAYAWLAANKRKFDVVIDDIYTAGSEDVFRSRGWNRELLGNLRRAVAPGGLLAVNLITGSGHRQMQSGTRRVMREAFPVVRSLVTPACMNEVLVAGEEVLPLGALRAWRDSFTHPRDRDFWDLIQSRRL